MEENACFENIIYMLSTFSKDADIENLVNPFKHLIEESKEGQKMNQEDIK